MIDTDFFRREFKRAQTKTDIFRLLYAACELFSIEGFILLDLDVVSATGLEAGIIFDACPAKSVKSFLSTKDSEQLLEGLAAEKFSAWSGQDKDENSILSSWEADNVVSITATTKSGSRLMLLLLNSRAFFSGHEFTRQMIEFREILARYFEVAVPDPTNNTLTERELEVARWTARGKDSGDIAQILGLSQYAINQYLFEAMNKMKAANRIQLVATCIRLGLI